MSFQQFLIKQLCSILGHDCDEWNSFNKKMKLKYIHRICSVVENDENINDKGMFENVILKDILEPLNIPIKSVKPKKLIQHLGFCKTVFNNEFKIFKQLMLDYTMNYRKIYMPKNNRIYYRWSTMDKQEKLQIMNDVNKIVYTFIKDKKINIQNFLNSILSTNFEHVILKNKLDFLNIDINIDEAQLLFYFKYNENQNVSPLTLIFKLELTSDNITNNIPVIYRVKLINNI